MKTTLLAITVFVLAIASFARAQPEPAATPAENPETAAPVDPTVSVPTEKTVKPTPTPKPTRSPAAATKPAAKKPASPPPKPVTSPTATAPAKKMSVEATLRDLENKWEASFQSRDTSVAEMILADDYLGVSSKGKILKKAALIAEMKKETDTFTSATNAKMDVRVFGNTAVVIGTSKEKGKDKEGKEFNRIYRWTDTWVERNGRWQCVASQAMLVPK